MADRQKTLAIFSLLAGASIWGLIWYPYRVLAAAGWSGVLASVVTYGVALVFGGVFWRARLCSLRFSWGLLSVGLVSAACNLSFIVATLQGEIVRVVLLFYLSPLWTLIFARVLLGERMRPLGCAVVVLALCGAAVMLWHPGMGYPWPRRGAEWLGLAAGVLFALANVLIKRTADIPIPAKSLAVFAGAVVLGPLATCIEPLGPAPQWTLASLLLLLGVGLVLWLVNVIVQFGLTHTLANQAIVILLFELVVAALGSWLLADEAMGLREWAGGALIVAATLFSGKMEAAALPGPET